MAGENLFNVQIGLTLNDNNLENQIKQIQEKLNKNSDIKLNINFGSSLNKSVESIKNMSSQVDNLSKQVNNLNVNKDIKLFNTENITSQIDKTAKSIESIKKELSGLDNVKNITFNSSEIDKNNNNLMRFIATVTKTTGEIEKLQYVAKEFAQTTTGAIPITYEFERLTKAIDNTDKVTKKLEEFKTKYSQIIDGMDNKDLLPENSINKIKESLNSLDETSNKINFDNIKKEINDLIKESNSLSKEQQDNFKKVISFVDEYQEKINNLYKNNNGSVPFEKLMSLEGKVNSLSSADDVSQLKEIKKLYQDILDLKKENEDNYNNIQKQKKEEENLYDYIFRQEERLKNLKATYSNKLNTDSGSYDNLENEYKNITDDLEKYREVGNKLNQEEKNNITSRINDLKRLSTEYLQINNFVQQQKEVLSGLQGKFKNILNPNEIESYVSALKNFDPTTDNVIGDMNKIIEKHKELKAELQERTRVSNLGENLGSTKNTGLNMGSSVNEIQKYLQSISNGKVQFNQLSESIDKTGNKVKEIHYMVNEGNNIFSKYTLNIDSATDSVYKLNKGMVDTSSKNRTFGETLKSALESVTGFSLISGAYFTTLSAMKDMITYIGEMDNALTDLNKVVDLSTSQLNSMKDSAIQLGQELGKSSIDIMNSMAEAGRQFKNTDDIKEFAETATMASNVTDMTAQQAAKSLTTVMKVFKQNIGDVKGDLDSFNEIQNNYRVSGEDLAHSIEKVGEAAAQTGTSMHELNGITTGLIQATGLEGSEAGTSIRAILSRTYSLGKEGADGKGMKALKEYAGEDVRDASGEFKSFSKILEETHAKWDGLTKSQQMALAQGVGGVQHYSQFMSIMENYKDVVAATNTSINSQDSALNENQKYLQSTAGKLGQLKATSEQLANDFINSDFTKGIIDFAKKAISGIDGVVKSFGSLQATIPIVTALLVGFSSKMQMFSTTNGEIGLSKNANGIVDNLKKGMENYKNNYANLKNAWMEKNAGIDNLSIINKDTPNLLETTSMKMKALTQTTTAQTIATNALKVTTLAMNMAMGMFIGFIISEAIQVITTYINKTKDMDDANKQLLQTQQSSIQGHQNNITQLEEMKKQYTEVENRINSMKSNGLQPAIEDQNTLNDLNSKIAQMMPNLVQGYDSQGKAIINLKGNYDDLIATEKEAIKQDALKTLNDAKNPKQVAEDKMKNLKAQMMGIKSGNIFDEMQSKVKASDINSGKSGVSDQEMAILKKQYEEQQQWYKPYLKTLVQANDAYTKLDPSLQKIVTDYTNIKGVFNNTKSFDEIEAKISLIGEALSKTDAQPLIKSIEELNAKAQTGTISTDKYAQELNDKLKDLASKTGISKDELQKMFDVNPSNLKKNVDNVAQSIDKMMKSVVDLQKDLSGNLEDINKYSKMLNEIKDKGIISESSQKEIITKEPELIPYLSDMGSLTTELTKKIDDLKTKSEGAFSAIKIQEEEKSIQTLIATYNELHDKNNLNITEKAKLAETVDALKGKVEGLQVSTTTEGIAEIKNIELTNNRIKSLDDEQKYLQLVAQAGKDKAKDMITQEISQTDKTYEEINKRIIAYQAEIDMLEKDPSDNGKNKDLQGGVKTIGAFIQKKSLESIKARVDAAVSAGDKDAANSANQLDGAIKTLTEDTNTSTQATKAQAAAIKEANNVMKDYENQLKSVDNLLKAQQDYTDGLVVGSQKRRDALKEQIDLLKQEQSILKNSVVGANNQANKLGDSSGSILGQQIVADAQKYLGTPYAWGGESPEGFDCSGLVQYVYKELNQEIGRTTYDQVKEGTSVAKENLQPGDLVFFGDISAPHHVGIYAGSGNMIEAPHTGDVVKVSSLNDRTDYAGARRIISGNNNSNIVSTVSSALPSAITAEQLNSILGGKLSGHGADYIKYGQQYGVDPALAAAISTFETGHGNVVTHNNPAGIMDWDNNWSTLRDFPSLSEGIQYAIKNLKTEYIDKGLTSISAIGSKYSPVGAANDPNGTNKDWIPGVASLYKQITGKDISSSENIASALENLQSKALSNQSSMLDKAKQIKELYKAIYEDNMAEFDRSAKEIDIKVQQLQVQNTVEKANNINSIINLKQIRDLNYDKLKVLKQEKDFLDTEVKNPNSVYDEATIQAMKEKISEITTSILDQSKSIKDSINNWIDGAIGNIENKFKDTFDMIENKLSRLNNVATVDLSSKLLLESQKVTLTKQKIEEITNAIKELNDYSYKTGDTTYVEKIKELTNNLDILKTTLSEDNKALEDTKNSISDLANTVMDKIKQVIQKNNEVYKNELESNKKLFEDAIDKEVEKLDEAQKKMQNNSTNYDNIQNVVKLQQQLNALDLRNDEEAKSKKADIQKELNEANRKLREDTQNQDIEARKDALSKAKSDYDKAVQEYSDNIDKSNTDQVINKQSSDALINGFIVDEYGNKIDLESALKNYEDKFGQGLTVIGNKIKTELIDKLKEVQNLMNKFKTLDATKIDASQAIKTVYGTGIDLENAKSILGANGYNYIDTNMVSPDKLQPKEGDVVLGNSIDSKLTNGATNIAGTDRYKTEQMLEMYKASISGNISPISSYNEDTLSKYIQQNATKKGNVYASGNDLLNAEKYLANYGYNFIDTNDVSTTSLNKNDVVVGGAGVMKGISNALNVGAKWLWGMNSKATENEIKEYAEILTRYPTDTTGFKDGGTIDFTGYAAVHGTPSEPETVLNNEQGKGLHKFLTDIPSLTKNIMSQVYNNLSSINIPSLQKLQPSVGDISNKYEINFHIDKINGTTEEAKSFANKAMNFIRKQG